MFGPTFNFGGEDDTPSRSTEPSRKAFLRAGPQRPWPAADESDRVVRGVRCHGLRQAPAQTRANGNPGSPDVPGNPGQTGGQPSIGLGRAAAQLVVRAREYLLRDEERDRRR